MPKDLVVVGQRGMAIIDRDTPSHIKGFFTHNLQTCAGLYVTDGEGKHGLLHVDKEMSRQSLQEKLSEHFPRVADFIYVKNPDYELEYGDTQMARIFSKICTAIEPLLGRRIEKSELEDSVAGTLMVEIDRESGDLKGYDTNLSYQLDLLERSTYDQDFESRRMDIHYANSACSNLKGARADLDLQYDGKKYTKLPKLFDDVASDFAVLFDYGLEFLSKGNLDFPKRFIADKFDVRPYGDEDEEDVAYRAVIAYGFIYRSIHQSCDLVEYKIPLVEGDTEREKLVLELAESVGEESEFHKIVAEGGRTICSAKLNPKSLTKEVLLALGLDQKVIARLSSEQVEILAKSIPDFSIENYKKAEGKVVITFPAGEENVEAIRNVVRLAKPSPSSALRDAAALAGEAAATFSVAK